ncbi:precorrin-6Y C5,15-methyltransferase (decarboxylating) subunit CbiT [Mycoplasma sp. P36-A1]|uniref:precorrin-6Y C5,15-methyltransferase (decarboxylating) subunit CbiT n=1 Tax=Mycoplasma sp. P36-A1 TaxID=3252900 RepID=UPI003C304A52
MKYLYIIGASDGSINQLSNQALTILKKDLNIYAFNRIAKENENYFPVINIKSLKNLNEILDNYHDNKDIVILVSGDVNFYSIAKTINNKYNKKYNISFIPGINIMVNLCAHFKLNYQEMANVSLHGQNKSYLGVIANNEYTCILLDNINTVNTVLKSLEEYDDLYYYIGENLGLDTQEFIQGNNLQLNQRNYECLAAMIVHNLNPRHSSQCYYDEDFIRNKTPMTKQETRWLLTSLLDLKETDIVFDIGAGSGSTAIEISNKVYKGMVYAFEYKDTAIDLIKRNAIKNRAMNINLIQGKISQVIDFGIKPDKVYIGGSEGELENVIQWLVNKEYKPLILLTANSIESLSDCVRVYKKYNIQYNITSISVARGKKINQHTLMFANNPIFIIKGEFNHEQ